MSRGLFAAAVLAVLAGDVCAAGEPPSVSTASALMEGLFALLIVLAALFAFFWLLRRFSPGQSGAQGVVKVVGGVMLGTRERLVVVEVGETWLLVGVGGGQVNTLHTMPRPEGFVPAGGAPLPGFADKLKDVIKRRT